MTMKCFQAIARFPARSHRWRSLRCPPPKENNLRDPARSAWLPSLIEKSDCSPPKRVLQIGITPPPGTTPAQPVSTGWVLADAATAQAPTTADPARKPQTPAACL